MKIKHCIVLLLAVIAVNATLSLWYVKTRTSAVKHLDTVQTQPAVDALITTSRPVGFRYFIEAGCQLQRHNGLG
jgi:hypothetical protein